MAKTLVTPATALAWTLGPGQGTPAAKIERVRELARCLLRSACMFTSLALTALVSTLSTAAPLETPEGLNARSNGAPGSSAPCASTLVRIEEARPTLRALRRSRARLLHKQRTLAPHAPGQAHVSAMLSPIERQAEALAKEVDRMEREYLRCVEHALDARAEKGS